MKMPINLMLPMSLGAQWVAASSSNKIMRSWLGIAEYLKLLSVLNLFISVTHIILILFYGKFYNHFNFHSWPILVLQNHAKLTFSYSNYWISDRF